MTDHKFIKIVVTILLLTGLCLGGLDQTGSKGSKNLTLSEFNAQVPQDSLGASLSELGAPKTAATIAGSDVAVYSAQVPPSAKQKTLQPSAILSKPPKYMYYGGQYLPWSKFSVAFPGTQPALWIEKAVSWSMYATLPWRGWTQVLIYVPTASPVTMYEIHPYGYVTAYELGFSQPGYYTLWYYADEPGRHTCMIATNSGYSNQIIIDVYGTYAIGVRRINPTPTPNPQKECEARGWPWVWQNGACVNSRPAPNPVAECEAKEGCTWANGECQCFKPVPNPVAECESNPLCHYVDGQCLCTGGNTDTKRQSCESNPLCDYFNGQCYCRGAKNIDPMPSPSPEPFNPAPNPSCGPGCYWSGNQCVCTGMMGSSNSGGGSYDDGVAGSSNVQDTY